MTATRYADHYKGDSAGYFDDIEYIAIDHDNTARMNALMTGQVDAINRSISKPKACCANPVAHSRSIRQPAPHLPDADECCTVR
jgi:peptide/nickel transport system substrate-binding protein